MTPDQMRARVAGLEMRVAAHRQMIAGLLFHLAAAHADPEALLKAFYSAGDAIADRIPGNDPQALALAEALREANHAVVDEVRRARAETQARPPGRL